MRALGIFQPRLTQALALTLFLFRVQRNSKRVEGEEEGGGGGTQGR
jgi:hypothetical protein